MNRSIPAAPMFFVAWQWLGLVACACLLIMHLALVTEATAAGKKKHGHCNDYGSKTNYMGQPYYVRDPEDGRVVRRHFGMDFCAKAGSDVLSAADGIVVSLIWDDPTRGGSVIMRTNIKLKALEPQSPLQFVYIRHLHINPDRNLLVGKEIRAGTVIGKVQKGGKLHIGPRPHVHFDAGNCAEVWLCHLNPNMFWADGLRKITCFDARSPPPRDKLIAPVRCR